MILERLNEFICKLLPKKKAVDPYYECYPNHLPRLMKELEMMNYKDDDYSYRFTVLEQIGCAIESVKFHAVLVTTDEVGDEDRKTISRHGSEDEAWAAVVIADKEFAEDFEP